MTNQNRRPGELEARLEARELSDAMSQLGNFQFLILRDLEQLEALRRKKARNSAKGKCRNTWRCHNKNLDTHLEMACKKSAGNSATDIKSSPSKTKGDLSDDGENTHSSELSFSTRISSDVDACVTPKFIRQPFCGRSSRIEEDDEKPSLNGKEQTEDGAQETQKEDMYFPVECFTQLYKRIEALEDLLQRGLDTFSKETCECKETNKNRKSVQQNKAKVPPQPNSKPGCELLMLPELIHQVFDPNDPGARGIQASSNEEKQSTNELQNIKKRLINLEEKMKRLKLSATQSNLYLRHQSKTNLALTKVEKRSKGTQEKQTDSQAQTYSQLESPVQSEILFINSALKDSADWKIKNKENKKVITKYKKIRTECSSGHTSKGSSRSRNGSATVLNCPSDNSVPRTRSFESTLYPLSKEEMWDKNKTPAVLYFKCKNASVAWPSPKCQDAKPKRVKDLCRKTPVTNFVLNQYPEKEISDPHAFGDCKFLVSPRKCGRMKKRSKGYLVSKPSPTGMLASHRRHTTWTGSKRSHRHPPVIEELSHQKIRHREREKRKEKHERGARTAGSPKEASTENDKIKIPVLFKEVCKPMKPIEKISNVSMRFVLVENDPKNPLRNLLEKMSKERSQSRAEQYVFGVSKCSCDEPKYANQKVPQWVPSPKPPGKEPLMQSILSARQKPAGGGPSRPGCRYT